jgi:hypothetical protein
MYVRLTKKDILTSEVLGADTVKLCEMAGFNPRLENDKQSRVEANQWGFKAEFAVARLFDLEPPTLTVTTDGGADLWVGDITIDVKLTNQEWGPLIFDSMPKFRANVAVLVGRTKDDEVVNVIGWSSREAFKEHYNKKDFGFGDRLYVDAQDLAPIEQLWLSFSEIKYGVQDDTGNSFRFRDNRSEERTHQGQFAL